MARRARSGRFLPAASSSGAPRKRKARKAPRSRRNPPAAKRNAPLKPAAKAAMSAGAAAVAGGLVAQAGVAIASRIASPGVSSVARVVVPALLGILATRVSHKHANALAAGAFGVAGAALAGVIADAIVRPNPPAPEEFWIDNPPIPVDLLTQGVNAGYRDGVTAALLAG